MVLRHPEYGKKTAVYHYQFCDWSANPSSLYEKDAPPVYLLLLLLLPQLQFSLYKIILFFTVLFPYYKLMLHVIYHNICFICLLASDPVLLIKLLNNLGAGNNTHRCTSTSIHGCYSVDNSSTRTQVRAFHGCNLVDNTSTGAQVWALHGCNLVDDANTQVHKYEHSMAAIFDSFELTPNWMDSCLRTLNKQEAENAWHRLLSEFFTPCSIEIAYNRKL